MGITQRCHTLGGERELPSRTPCLVNVSLYYLNDRDPATLAAPPLFDPVTPQSNYALNECAVHVLNITVEHRP